MQNVAMLLLRKEKTILNKYYIMYISLVEGKAISGLRDDAIEKKIRLKLNDKMMNGDNTTFSIGEWEGEKR